MFMQASETKSAVAATPGEVGQRFILQSDLGCKKKEASAKITLC